MGTKLKKILRLLEHCSTFEFDQQEWHCWWIPRQHTSVRCLVDRASRASSMDLFRLRTVALMMPSKVEKMPNAMKATISAKPPHPDSMGKSSPETTDIFHDFPTKNWWASTSHISHPSMAIKIPHGSFLQIIGSFWTSVNPWGSTVSWSPNHGVLFGMGSYGIFSTSANPRNCVGVPGIYILEYADDMGLDGEKKNMHAALVLWLCSEHPGTMLLTHSHDFKPEASWNCWNSYGKLSWDVVQKWSMDETIMNHSVWYQHCLRPTAPGLHNESSKHRAAGAQTPVFC